MTINGVITHGITQETTTVTKSKTEEVKKDLVNKESEESTQAVTDTYEKVEETSQKGVYSNVKKLSSNQVQAMKENQEVAKVQMLQQMMSANMKNQSLTYGISQGSQDLWTKIFGSIDAALPALATNKEEAQKALEKGGAYSVEAVADRIMKMAEALAGGDSSKISLLRGAVEKGFKQAGIEFESKTESGLPQICKDTYDEVMKRFDTWEKKSATDNTKTSKDEEGEQINATTEVE